MKYRSSLCCRMICKLTGEIFKRIDKNGTSGWLKKGERFKCELRVLDIMHGMFNFNVQMEIAVSNVWKMGT